MKKCFTLAVLAVLALTDHLYAGSVSLADAQNVAINFFKVMKASNTTYTASLKYTKTSGGNAADFYVFDISPDMGFVIVAGDDNVIPVLGYSTESYFRTDFTHVGLNKWINRTSANIRLALQNNAVADTRIKNQWTAYRQGYNPVNQRSGTVSPLCTTRWDQENENTNSAPYWYNLYCPYDTADQQRALTGCVATAMAQVMKYWGYPAQGIDSFTYEDATSNGYSNDYGTQSANFGHTYNWALMPTRLNGNETAAQDSAVDRLMYDCAVSVGMDFGDDNQDGSGSEALIADELAYGNGDSTSSQYAFVKYFSYDPDSISGIFRSDYTDSVWTAILKKELDKGRPFMYGGFDTAQGGHEWVCDGYDATNKLHMNWGWGGADNGYFAVTDLTTSGNFNPVQYDDALIGIVPKRAHTTTTGVNAIADEFSFSIYPNPASRDVVLQTALTTNTLTWNVRNVLGQTLVNGNVEAAQTHIDVSGLSAGIYLVELRDGDRPTVKKLIINK